MTFNSQTLAVVLAALRLLEAQGCPPELEDTATDGGRFPLPTADTIDALAFELNEGSIPVGGEISDWNTGENLTPFTVSHVFSSDAISLQIPTPAPDGTVDSGEWNVMVELDKGVPVVRSYRPGDDEPLSTFRFPAADVSEIVES